MGSLEELEAARLRRDQLGHDSLDLEAEQQAIANLVDITKRAAKEANKAAAKLGDTWTIKDAPAVAKGILAKKLSIFLADTSTDFQGRVKQHNEHSAKVIDDIQRLEGNVEVEAEADRAAPNPPTKKIKRMGQVDVLTDPKNSLG
jgi:hypothetical protein